MKTTGKEKNLPEMHWSPYFKSNPIEGKINIFVKKGKKYDFP